MQVCLFDIDGTLLNTGGAGSTAMLASVEAEFGVQEPLHGIPAAGRTDRAITLDVFNAFGLPLDEATYARFLDVYVSLLPEHLKMHTGTVFPGVAELLSALRGRGDVALGLLTGNFQSGAWLKLKHYALHEFFDFGGFGDRYVHRNDVAREALELIRRRLGADFDPSDVWVVGDTPADVECARAIGANAIAVATGIFSAEELAAANPDFLWNDLSDIERFLRLMSL